MTISSRFAPYLAISGLGLRVGHIPFEAPELLPEQVVIDPNQLSPDGSVALSGFSPSPDGRNR